MRGAHREPDSMFSYVPPEQRIPKDHPLRAIRVLVDEVLADMSREFNRLYAATGRPSIPRNDGKTDGDGKNFHGQTRTNDTHASTTDPDAKLYLKSNGAESRLAYLGHLLIENRHGLIVDAMATQAEGRAERDAGLLLLHAQWKRAVDWLVVFASAAFNLIRLPKLLPRSA